MLELRHLRTLMALAEAGSVSRAAERVHLTQSALSHQLKALERQYGVAVVERHGQTVRLTESGRRLVTLALEPEPCCLLETTDETLAFFEQQLRGLDGGKRHEAALHDRTPRDVDSGSPTCTWSGSACRGCRPPDRSRR